MWASVVKSSPKPPSLQGPIGTTSRSEPLDTALGQPTGSGKTSLSGERKYFVNHSKKT